MYILVLPVSGGGFVNQLASIQHLCESEFVPDLTLASSGGNVAAYVAVASDWKWAGIKRISRDLTQKLFVKQWSNIAPISFVIGYFQGAVYNKGQGVSDFLNKHFSPESITKYEIWTGAYNKDLQQACLFCNKDESILNLDYIDHDLTQSMKPVFANGDISLISQYGTASASIPAFVPEQKIDANTSIDGGNYIDGGLAGASPMTIMYEPILNYITEHSEPMHLVYVNSVDLSSPNLTHCNNVIDIWRQATYNLVRSQTVHDRLSCYSLLRCRPGIINKCEFKCNYENMQKVKEIQSRCMYSMLEIYPAKTYEVCIDNFNGDDVIKKMEQAYEDSRCRFWWITQEKDHQTIDDHRQPVDNV